MVKKIGVVGKWYPHSIVNRRPKATAGSSPACCTRYGYRRVATPLALGARDRKFDSYYPYQIIQMREW